MFTVERIRSPGATRSTQLPWLEKGAIWSWMLVAPTPITFG